jgi:hypothetical protein
VPARLLAVRRATALAGVLTAALAIPGTSTANDSAAELAAGGLVLVKTDAIVMQREDLTLSPSEVRVRYEMRNDTGHPVTLRVAFPMPEVPRMTPDGMETSGGAHNIAIKPPTDPNFMDFRLWANQQELTPEVEIRSEMPDGRDISAALREIGGLRLMLQPGVFTEGADKPLDAEAIRKLRALSAIEMQPGSGWYLPWTTKVTFHWILTFAPGVTIVEHSYRPVLGWGLFVFRETGRIGSSSYDDPVSAYCIDKQTERTLHDLLRSSKRADGALISHTLGYILRTARNWHGPIGTFHLTLTGGSVADSLRNYGVSHLISMCSDLAVQKTGPQRFEATVRNYVPEQDIRALFVTD